MDIKYYPFIFNQSASHKLSKANYYVKNGRLPNNISEKFTYLFDAEGRLSSLAHFSQIAYSQPYTDFIFHFSGNKIVKMDLIKYMQTLNQPPYTYTSDSTRSVIIVPKTELFNDSTYFYPSFESPKLTYTRSNNKTIEVNFYFPIGTELEEIKKEVEASKNQTQIDDFTYIYITYTDNDLPIETVEMSAKFDYSSKIRSWEYNSDWLPIRYKEYMLSNLIKDLSIEYNQQQLPNYLRLNKKVFYAHYEFWNAN